MGYFVGKPEGMDHLEDPGVERRMGIQKVKWGGGFGVEWFGSE
jgi:hypothetical protein